MLHLQLTNKRFDQTLLQNIDLQLEPGTLNVMVGPSGCGKSTILNIIAGLDKSFEGRITRLNREEIRLAYMFQEPRLLPWRTIRQNLELISSDLPRIDQLLKAVDLYSVSHKYPGQISLGMARRIALLRCFLHDPDLILMDEPLVSLDREAAATIKDQLKLMRKLRPELTILYVTHDLEEASVLADRLFILGGAPTTLIQESAALSRQQLDQLLSETVTT